MRGVSRNTPYRAQEQETPIKNAACAKSVSTRMYLTNAKQILKYVARGCIVLRALEDEGLRKRVVDGHVDG
jgi:hypothetical protein